MNCKEKTIILNKIILFFLLICPWLNQKIFAQNITYTISENLAICEQTVISFDVKNMGSTVLIKPEVIIDLPCGFAYNPSTATNAVQKSISDLNKPVFTLNNINAGEKYTFTIIATIGCDAVECVNNLQVFNILSTFTSNNITTESTSLPFNVQSPNLVITKIENPYVEAQYNDVITRKVVVKNSRLGKLSRFIYKNSHNGNVYINLEGGTSIQKTTKTITQLFDAIDFRKIGNKDDYLDFNEEIVISEKIKMTNCSFENQFNNATINITWGCNEVICQMVQANATIKILPSKDKGPKIAIRTTFTNPDCYYPGMSPQRIDIIESFHKNSLLNFEIEIKQSIGNRGIKVGSLTAPFSSDIQYKGLFKNDCGESLARIAIIKVPKLEPITGQKLSTITWQTAFCEQVVCDPPHNAWSYKFNYLKECSEFDDTKFMGKGVSADSTRSALETFFLLYDQTTPVADMDTTIAKYTIFSDKLIQNQGTITILFEFPTILKLLNTDFSLGGKLPFAIDTIHVNGRVQVKLSYNLPLSGKDLEMFIPFILDCNARVLVDPCVERPFSSCTFRCDLDINSDYISSITSIDFGVACPTEGLLRSCSGSSFATYCDNNICNDTIPGFYDYSFDFFRTNYGISDRDNNGFPDATNVIDPSILKLKEFMPGDTMKMIFDGIIKVDIPGSTFTNLNILLQQLEFLSSSAANTAFMENLLFGEGNAFKQYRSILRIYDKSENQYYTFDNIKATIADTYTNYDLSIGALRVLDASFPSDFRYQEGDSIYLEINNRLDLNAFKANMDGLDFRQYVTYRYEANNFLGNKPWDDESVLSICNCSEGIVQIAGFDLTAPVVSSLIFNEPEICDGAIYNNLIFLMGIGHDLKSTNEIREVARPTGLKITKLPDFDLETLTVEYKLKFYTFEPTFIGPNEYFYDISGNFPIAGTFAGNQYKFSIRRRLKECLSKVIPTPFVYTVFFEKNEIGALYFPDSIVGTIQNFYTLPSIAIEINQKNITAFSNKAGFAMNIREKTNFRHDVKDLFMRITHTTGLKNARVYDPLTGADFASNNGIFNLGTLKKGQIKNIEFITDAISCGEEKILIEYGYDCGIYSDIATSPCFTARDSVYFTFPGSVVDLQPENVNADIALCEVLSNKLYVFNAGLGTAFDMKVGMALPTGMTLVPGSCRIFYPAGGTQSFAITDPVNSSFNNYIWDLNNVWPLHKLSGLNGTSFAPNNGFDIVFGTTTNCDFISGTTIIYNTEARQICNISTNKVAKVSNTFSVNGILPPYTVNIKSDYTKPQDCKNDSLKIEFSFDKPFVNEGKVYVDLPQGWVLIPNSVQGNLNNIIPIIENNKLIWDINADGTNVEMTFWLRKTAEGNCQPALINIYTTLSTTAFCTTSMADCDIETITGSSSLNIPIENPIFEISNFVVKTDLSGNTILTVTLKNKSTFITNDILGKIYIDQDGNGAVNSGDLLLGELLFSGFSDVNTSAAQILSLNGIENLDYCKLLFILAKTDNCICEDLISNIKFPTKVISEPKIICSGEEINLGVLSNPNTVYQWNAVQGMSCTQCANAVFSLDNNAPNPITLNKILTVTNNNGCQTLYEYVITIQPKPTVLSQNLSICAGDTLTAIATMGTSYVWEGPNIIENGNQLLRANPTVSTSYTVTITDENGCIGTGTLDVIVKNKPTIDVIYDSLYCYGPSPQLNLILEPNTTFRWLNASGKLNDLNILDPTVLTQEDIILQIEIRNTSCVSIIAVPIKYYEAFMVTGVEDTLATCFGEKIKINLGGGQNYTINPSSFVVCNNDFCSDISIDAVFDQQTFTITAQDQEMCISEKTFTIITFTDTIRLNEQLSICTGDTITIFDENISTEGIYCDTIKTENSACITISCKTLTVKPRFRQDQAINICPGDTYVFGGQTITQAGLYCNNFTSFNGCDSITCINVSLYKLPDLSSLTLEYSVKSGDTITLIAPSGFSSYLWTPSDGLSCDDCSLPLAFPLEDIIYTLEVTDDNGCITSRTIRIDVTPSCIGDILTIPNAFTPNNDGINDFYTLGDIELCGPMIFTVYNRWGNQVYQMIDWDNHWDGYSNNAGELPQGTYYVSIAFVSEGVTRVGFVDLRKK